MAAAVAGGDLNAQLMNAIIKKDLPKVDELIHMGADVNQESEEHYQMPPLHLATQIGALEIVDRLLKVHGIDVNGLTSEGGNPPLLIAIANKNMAIVNRLLEVPGIDVHITSYDGDESPIHLAAYLGNSEILNRLLEVPDIDVNYRLPRDGRTALFVAAYYGRIQILNRLLEIPDIDVNQSDKNAMSPLHIATESGHLEIVERLLSVPGIDVNKPNKNGLTPLHIAIQKGSLGIITRLSSVVSGINVNQLIMENGVRLFSIAIQEGNGEFVELLLSIPGIDVNKAFSDGMTPLHMAIQLGNVEIVNRLLSVTAIDVNKPMKDDVTPLHMAIQLGNVEIVNQLLRVTEIEVKKTFLPMAIKNGFVKIVNRLLPGIDVNEPVDDVELTPLILAIQSRQVEIVIMLLSVPGIDVNKQRNDDGSTPLWNAANIGDLQIVNQLLKAPGIDVNKATTNENGRMTPLHAAIDKNHLEIAKRLLEDPRIDVNKSMMGDKTPLFLAAQKGQLDIVKRLLEFPDIDFRHIRKPTTTNKFSPAISKLIFNSAPEAPKWQPITQTGVSVFDAIFDTEQPPKGSVELGSVAENVSMCPVCFKYSRRMEGCEYVKHDCSEVPGYIHMELYDKYNDTGEITWCTICGRICRGHTHYPLTDPREPRANLPRRNTALKGCGGGGGLEEKFARFRKVREVLKKMDPSLSYEDAMDIVIEEMWRAPITSVPLESNRIAMMAAKKFTNYPTENFPPNVKPVVTEEVNIGLKKTIPTLDPSLLPEIITFPTSVMNSISYEDITTILHLKHNRASRSDAHADELDITKDTDRIGLESFFDILKSNMNKGTKAIGLCWKHPVCQTLLHPDEVDEAVRLASSVVDSNSLKKYQDIARRYRGLFIKEFGVVQSQIGEAGATGGGQAQPAGGAGLGRRTRTQARKRRHGQTRRRRQRGGAVGSVVDLIRSRFAPATNAVCVPPERRKKVTRRRKAVHAKHH